MSFCQQDSAELSDWWLMVHPLSHWFGRYYWFVDSVRNIGVKLSIKYLPGTCRRTLSIIKLYRCKYIAYLLVHQSTSNFLYTTRWYSSGLLQNTFHIFVFPTLRYTQNIIKVKHILDYTKVYHGCVQILRKISDWKLLFNKEYIL